LIAMRATRHATRHRRAIASSALASVLCSLVPTPVRASDPPPSTTPIPPEDSGMRARARYDAGTQAFSQGRIVEAALQFEAAAAEKPSAIALYTAALSWERANVPQRAADDYTRALAIGGLSEDASAHATLRLQALEAVLGSVLVSGPADWRVQLDANAEVPVPATLHGASGVHTLTVHATGRAIAPIAVVLQSGVAIRLRLPEPALAPSAEDAAPGAPRGSDLRASVGFVALGAAGVALLSGGLLGAEALDARDAYRAGPTQASFDHAENLQRWTDAAWIAGGVLAVGGLALVLWPTPRRADASAHVSVGSVRAGVAPTGLFVAGDFE
jgi:hypothetical protein